MGRRVVIECCAAEDWTEYVTSFMCSYQRIQYYVWTSFERLTINLVSIVNLHVIFSPLKQL